LPGTEAESLDGVGYRHDIGAGLAEDRQVDGLPVLVPALAIGIFHTVDHLGHVLEPDRAAILVGDNLVAEFRALLSWPPV